MFSQVHLMIKLNSIYKRLLAIIEKKVKADI